MFPDLDDPDADLKQAKAILAARIVAVLDRRGLSVRKAGALTRFAAADFSRVRNADLGRFTLDRLMRMLAALDGDLRVTLRVDAGHGGEAVMTKQRRSAKCDAGCLPARIAANPARLAHVRGR